ncbi:RHS repeat-associated core domain-containing protein [Acinetobacter sp. V102_4]|uniref:RHS repeat-associated core domain-containing protein n=1 Tax=Acinetobacter sp. V102_4 TaxID=3072984 RepID=UPI00287EE334|nr:RHS repeat-associated core domain-containing protein [Acinetobacter sp. V102_4]MDS7928645.1 RHS repeat-associated core domain-containing protein [Acinetobacter sp. V102_4]
MKSLNHVVQYIIFFCSLTILSLFNQTVHAETEDIVAYNYAAARAPGIQSCTYGYDLLSGDISYNKTQITGALPYNLNYRAPLRRNFSAAQTFFQPETSRVGWTDNYHSHVIVQNITEQEKQYKLKDSPTADPNTRFAESYDPVITVNAIKAIIVRLPGEVADTVFLEKDGAFRRLFSADPVALLNRAYIYSLWDGAEADGLGEYQLSRSGSNLIISKNGVQYTITGTSYRTVSSQTSLKKINYSYLTTDYLLWGATKDTWTISNRPYYAVSNTTPHIETSVTVSMDLYRVAKIDDKQGNVTNLQYDSKMNLTQVSDRYNNKLVFERAFHDVTLGASQTVDESRLITKVTYTAAQGGTQVATFNYKAYANKAPSTGTDTYVFALISSDSTVAGAYSYTNEMTEIGAIKLYVAQRGATPDSSYYFPVLTEVKNAAGQGIIKWLITQNYYVIGSGPNAYLSVAKTTLRTYVPATLAGGSRQSLTSYDDNFKTISTKVSLSNLRNGTATIKSSYNEMEVTGYPCLTVDGKPADKLTFDERSRLTYVSYPNSGVNYTYDDLNRVTEVTEYDRTTKYTYGPLNNNTVNLLSIPTSIVAPNLTITNVINPRGQIVTQTQTSSQTGSTSKVTTYGYDETTTSKHFGRLLSVDGPRSGTADKIIYAYDTYGNLASQTQTVNGTARITQYLGYNTFGSPERIVNPSGLVSQFIYNTDGTLKSQTVGVGGATGTITGPTTSYTYNAIKQRISETNPDGEITSFTYDQIGSLIETKLPNGNRIQNTYHGTGTLASEKSLTSAGAVAAERYQDIDDNGRVSKTQQGSDAARQYTTFTYDSTGNLIQSTSAEGITEKWTYDAFNRVTSHTDSAGNVDTKEYDVNDNIVLSKDALNAGSNPFSYRNGNVLTQEVNTDYGTKAYTYNEADQLIQRLHGPRKCNYNTLDELGRYKAFVCAANSGTTANEYQVNDNYSYDQSRYGRLDKVTTGVTGYDVDTLYTYDAYDRVTQKSTTNQLFNRYANTLGKTLNVNYGYSTGGKLTSMTLPSGRSVTYSYSSTTGMLTGINLNGSALVRSLSYDGANRVTGWQWGASGNAGYTQSYNNDGSIASLTNKDNASAVNYSLNFGYDKDGRITLVTRHNGTKDAYTYDVVDRLLSESRTTGTAATYSISYTYDKNGNRLTLNATGQHMQPAASAAYTYTTNTNKLASFTKGGVAQTFSHTANSELSYGTYLPTYDYAGRRKVDRASTDYYFMNYNHKNERSFRDKVVNGAVSTMTQYIYDEESHLIGEYDKTGALVEYVWMGGKPVAAIYGSGAATKIYYIVTDHLNTPRRLVDGVTHAVVWSWDSTAFGVGNPTGSITFNLRFPGQYYDVGTNQFYNHNRFYNPELGRYMEPDPIGLEGGLNPYAYAGSNSVMNVDPSGLSFQGPTSFMPLNNYQLSNVHVGYDFFSLNLSIDYSINKSIGYQSNDHNLWVADGSRSRGQVNLSDYTFDVNPLGKAFSLVGVGRGGGTAPKASANYYRGAREGSAVSFIPRQNDFKIDQRTGYVKDTHGLSIFNNPNSVSSKGFVPYRIDPKSISDQLRIIQRGNDPNHYEITPRPGADLKPEQYIKLCSNIKCL